MSQEKMVFSIDGMSCQACALRIEKVLRRQDGIQEANVNFAGESAEVIFDGQTIQKNQIIQKIQQAGFDAQEMQNTTNKTVRPDKTLYLILIIALIFAMEMVAMLLGKHFFIPPFWQFILAFVAQTICAWKFYQGAFSALKNKTANMDVLVSLGTLSVFIYSSVMYFSGSLHHIYFESAVFVLAFVSLGKFLELRIKRQSLNSMTLLMELTPEYSEVFRHQTWEKIPTAQIQMGDTVRAISGGRIAADGQIIHGEAWCDESHLTGESVPIHKTIGDTVLAGALLQNGSVDFIAQALGKDTLLGDMMQALREAQGSKAPIARMADKVASIFVPAVITIALLTFCFTYWMTDLNTALMRAAAVLVIACPCALGLATPAAIMAGMGLAARHGILFKDATVLEQAGSIDTVLLDKTGTITSGKPQIIDFRQPENQNTWDENQWLQIAASIETHTSHPLAQAIVDQAKERSIPLLNVEDIQMEAALGIQAKVGDLGIVKIGTPTYCETIFPDDTAYTIIAMRIQTQVAFFTIADTIRDDSKIAINTLHHMSIETQIVSGDRQEVVDDIAQKTKIDHAIGNQSPRDKAKIIHQLQQNGKQVAMVGDGINDAAALAAANVGFAMRGGTSIAEHSAHAVLMRPSIQTVADAITVARATLRNIRQNLFFAFIYNLLGIPLAITGMLSPNIAGGAMALSSISVLLNALRLKKYPLKYIR